MATTAPIEYHSHHSSDIAETSNKPIYYRRLLSLRSLLLIILIVVLLSGPAFKSSDLFAATLGYSLLITIFLTIVTTLILGNVHRSYNSFSITYDLKPYPNGKAVSSRPLLITLHPKIKNLLPFYSLWVTPIFKNKLETSTFRITGNFNKEINKLEQEILFPHRGNWALERFTLEIKDALGLSSFSWTLPISRSFSEIKVYPPLSYDLNIQPFSSDNTAGDDLTDLRNTNGELFDIKRYHPSDGMKKILWKVYAKSGELLARHPEPSITPEGTIVLYAICGRSEDHVASALLAHIEDLERIGHKFLVDVDGSFNVSAATEFTTIEERLLDTVWVADQVSEQNRINQINNLDNQLQELTRNKLSSLTIFVGAERLGFDIFTEQMISLGKNLSEKGIKLLWIIVQKIENSDKLKIKESELPMSFLQFCMASNWQNKVVKIKN